LNITTPSTLQWFDIPGGTGAYPGGDALGIFLSGVTLAIVPGGGGGPPGTQGGWYGSSGGFPPIISGQSATTSSPGTAGIAFTGPALAQFAQPTSVPMTSFVGQGLIPANSPVVVSSGTVITAPTGTSIIDNSVQGSIIINPGTGNVNRLTFAGSSWRFTNTSFTPINNSVSINVPSFSSTFNLSPYPANSGPTLTILNGIQTLDAATIQTIPSMITFGTGSYNIAANDIWKFVAASGASLTITITDPAFYTSISIDTGTNTATFLQDVPVTFSLQLATNPSVNVSTSANVNFSTSVTIPVSDVLREAGTIAPGGGGGGGLFQGGGGMLGGAGGAGSAYILPGYTLSVSGGTGSYLPITQYSEQYGWGGTNPALPQIIIEQSYTRPSPLPALIVNGNVIIGSTAGYALETNNILCNNLTSTSNVTALAMQVGSNTTAEAGIGFVGSTGSSYIVYRSSVPDILTNVNNIAALSVGSTLITSFVPFQSNSSIYATEGYASGSQAAGLPAQFPGGAVGGHQNDPLTTPRGISSGSDVNVNGNISANSAIYATGGYASGTQAAGLAAQFPAGAVGVNQTTALSTPRGIASGSDINVTGNITSSGYIQASAINYIFASAPFVIDNGSNGFYTMTTFGIYEVYVTCRTNSARDCYAKFSFRTDGGNTVGKILLQANGTNSIVGFGGPNNTVITLYENGQSGNDTFTAKVYPTLRL